MISLGFPTTSLTSGLRAFFPWSVVLGTSMMHCNGGATFSLSQQMDKGIIEVGCEYQLLLLEKVDIHIQLL